MWTDNTRSCSDVRAPELGNFNKYLQKLIDIIFDTKLFYSVGTFVREAEAIKCPSCVLYPKGRKITEQLTGAQVTVEYTIGIAIAVKHPKDSVIVQMVLDYAEHISNLLSRAIPNREDIDEGQIQLVFNDIEGHYMTGMIQSEFGDVKQLSETILAYNTGINVVFTANETV